MKDKPQDMFNMDVFGRQFAMRTIHVTSAASTFIFAMVYGVIEHTLLTSSLGISILVHPLSVHIVGQIFFYHVLMFILAVLISFNPFFDILFFASTRTVKKQALLWGTGNILNFIWLEDLFYWVLFGEWPKDVMTPLHLSFYGIVWWYPVALFSASFLYYLTIRSMRKMKESVNDK
ncbi:hypothetical protein NTE_03096 [Candidatus Nitrososphaera evergladensis SR1]|jgi:hypothetical protein|uniref:Uncharacterized protein n=1 Tax=Candidatus Nitrososphaera evergladensis SR1 TaxID=1459636 RepID=A0A075MV51_9ARCH|nr:hypothetical protein [Candidatus Nitrososphaera evergladensis]AIF85130.1 hypothetical protein NTE_03096 [Candidatus Nitrososphaera evergladensis SR1]